MFSDGGFLSSVLPLPIGYCRYQRCSVSFCDRLMYHQVSYHIWYVYRYVSSSGVVCGLPLYIQWEMCSVFWCIGSVYVGAKIMCVCLVRQGLCCTTYQYLLQLKHAFVCFVVIWCQCWSLACVGGGL